MPKVKVFAPATIGNVGPCFDRAGLAVAEPGDVVIAELKKASGVEIVKITGDGGRLSLDPEKNTAGVVAREILFLADERRGVRIWLQKGMPLFSGLGSSAASSAAAAVAVNELLGRPFTKPELLPACGEGERLACGVTHLDNVAPSLFGGLVTIENERGEQHKLAYDFSVVLVTPQVDVPTKESRAAIGDMRTELEKDAREKVARLVRAKTLKGLTRVVGDNALLEKARGGLIPGFAAAQKAGLAAGALSVTISGSGPTVFALVEKKKAKAVEKAIVAAFKQEAHLPAQSWVTRVDARGARVIK